MVFSTIAIIILGIGLLVVFTKEIKNMFIYSSMLTIILFAALLLKGNYFLALVYILIDGLVKAELYLYFVNKDISRKQVVFKKNRFVEKLMSSLGTAALVSVVYFLYKEINEVVVEKSAANLDILILSVVLILFIAGGYISKSGKWKL